MEKESQRDSKKNPFVLLAGVCSPVGANQTKADAIKIANTNNKKMRLHSFVLRYKSGLEDCLCDISSTEIRKNGLIVVGELGLAVAGANFSNGAFSGFPLPGRKPIISNNDNVLVGLKAQGTPINARDVQIVFLAEEIED